MEALVLSLLENFKGDSFLYLLKSLHESCQYDTKDQALVWDFMKTVILKACQLNNVHCLKHMLRYATELFADGQTEHFIEQSIVSKSWDCVKLLMNKLVKINMCAVTRWFCASRYDHDTFLLFVCKGGEFSACACGGDAAIQSAVLADNFELVEACLTNGCSAVLNDLSKTCHVVEDFDSARYQPITVAILNNNAELVRLLLEHGAKLDVCDALTDASMTPLCLASSMAHVDIITNVIFEYRTRIARDIVTLSEYFHDMHEAMMLLLSMEISEEWKPCFNQLLTGSTENGRICVGGHSLLTKSVKSNNPYALMSLLKLQCCFRNNNNYCDLERHNSIVKSNLLFSVPKLTDSTLDMLIKAGGYISTSSLAIADDTRVSTVHRDMKLSDWCRVTVRRNLKDPTPPDSSLLDIPNVLVKFLNFRALM